MVWLGNVIGICKPAVPSAGGVGRNGKKDGNIRIKDFSTINLALSFWNLNFIPLLVFLFKIGDEPEFKL